MRRQNPTADDSKNHISMLLGREWSRKRVLHKVTFLVSILQLQFDTGDRGGCDTSR